MPLSLLVEPLELASEAIQNIPSKMKTKTLQQKKRVNGEVTMAGLWYQEGKGSQISESRELLAYVQKKGLLS